MLVLSMVQGIVMLSALTILNSSTEKLMLLTGNLMRTTWMVTWALVNMVHAVPRWTSGRLTAWLLHTPRTLVVSRSSIAAKELTAVIMIKENVTKACVTKTVAISTLIEWGIPNSMDADLSMQ